MANPPVELESLPEGVRLADERLIKITPAAQKKIVQLLAKEENPSAFLRIRVTGGGCSGLSYKLKFVDAPKRGDMVVVAAPARLSVDSKSALYLKGMELDFSDKLVAGGFKFHNPNAKASCSCGESFAV